MCLLLSSFFFINQSPHTPRTNGARLHDLRQQASHLNTKRRMSASVAALPSPMGGGSRCSSASMCLGSMELLPSSYSAHSSIKSWGVARAGTG